MIGGSGYFDGSGDSLSVANNAAFDVGSGNFTVEAWVYLSSTSGSVFNYSNGQSTNANFAWEIYQISATTIQVSVFQSTSQYTASSTSLVANAWNHVAGVRNGNTLTIYVNGVAGGTTASVTGVTVNNPASSTVKVSGYNNASAVITGYVADARMVKGTAVYTANFTPPTVPLTAITNTSLLLSNTNAGILDNAMMNDLETVGNAQISTSVKKYGTGSLYFDGTGDYLAAVYTPNNNLGTGSFTFEAWIYPTNISGIDGIYAISGGSGANPKFVVHLNAGVPDIHYNNLTNGSNIYTPATSAVSANTWTHIAFVRNGSTWTWYINGTAAGTGSNSTNITFTTQPLYVGYGGEGYFTEFNGYIDDLRVTKGVARYTANFTPPTAPFKGK